MKLVAILDVLLSRADDLDDGYFETHILRGQRRVYIHYKIHLLSEVEAIFLSSGAEDGCSFTAVARADRPYQSHG